MAGNFKFKQSFFRILHTFFCCLLVVFELFLIVTHFMVLINYFNIKNMDLTERKVYFSADMASVLIAYWIIGNKNWFLTSLHFIVHTTAVMHLLGYETFFYTEVFRLAESIPSSFEITTIYNVLTAADITCHAVNCYLLLSIVFFGASYKKKVL